MIADDASPQPLEPQLRAAAPAGLDLRVVRSEANGGPGAARNRALAVAQTPWIAYLDADERPAPGYVARLEALARDDATADLVAGQVVIRRRGPVRSSTRRRSPRPRASTAPATC